MDIRQVELTPDGLMDCPAKYRLVATHNIIVASGLMEVEPGHPGGPLPHWSWVAKRLRAERKCDVIVNRHGATPAQVMFPEFLAPFEPSGN